VEIPPSNGMVSTQDDSVITHHSKARMEHTFACKLYMVNG